MNDGGLGTLDRPKVARMRAKKANTTTQTGGKYYFDFHTTKIKSLLPNLDQITEIYLRHPNDTIFTFINEGLEVTNESDYMFRLMVALESWQSSTFDENKPALYNFDIKYGVTIEPQEPAALVNYFNPIEAP